MSLSHASPESEKFRFFRQMSTNNNEDAIHWYRSKVFTWAYQKISAPDYSRVRVGTFSVVTGGRAPSFHDLSVGEALAPATLGAGEQRRGQVSLADKS